MAAVSHPLFGTLDPSAPGSWDATLTFEGRPVAVHLTIESSELPLEAFQSTLRFAEDVASLDGPARVALRRDLDQNEDSAVGWYTSHHLEELSDATLLGLFAKVERETLDADGFLAKMALVRIGLYPENAKRPVVFAYSLGTHLTDYSLVVTFDSSGQASDVQLES